MDKKKFLISIDTEGDNLWEWEFGKKITTENAHYLRRFQVLCDKYEFKPTYLTNYEMAADDIFFEFAKQTLDYGGCEIGMHLHAWNSPPYYGLKERNDGVRSGCPYLIEYPYNIIEEKVAFMTEYLETRFGIKPTTHRAGRWAMNEKYFEILQKYGYEVDCSITPGLSWENAAGYTNGSFGSDYREASQKIDIVNNTNILEIPMTVCENHRVLTDEIKTLKHTLGNYYRAIKGQGKIWLRPNGKNLKDMLYIADTVAKTKSGYIMFMLHSSELMPGGSYTFNTQEKIENLYYHMEKLFEHIGRMYEGMTIGEYGRIVLSSKIAKRERGYDK